MVGPGVLFAIDDETLARLGDATNEEEVFVIVNELEERWESACELDDGWSAIARTCEAVATSDARRAALAHAVVGETSLTDGDIVVTVNAEDRAAAIAASLARFPADEFRAAYAASLRGGGSEPYDEDEVDWCTERFERLARLYDSAQRTGRAVVFVGASVA